MRAAIRRLASTLLRLAKQEVPITQIQQELADLQREAIDYDHVTNKYKNLFVTAKSKPLDSKTERARIASQALHILQMRNSLGHARELAGLLKQRVQSGNKDPLTQKLYSQALLTQKSITNSLLKAEEVVDKVIKKVPPQYLSQLLNSLKGIVTKHLRKEVFSSWWYRVELNERGELAYVLECWLQPSDSTMFPDGTKIIHAQIVQALDSPHLEIRAIADDHKAMVRPEFLSQDTGSAVMRFLGMLESINVHLGGLLLRSSPTGRTRKQIKFQGPPTSALEQVHRKVEDIAPATWKARLIDLNKPQHAILVEINTQDKQGYWGFGQDESPRSGMFKVRSKVMEELKGHLEEEKYKKLVKDVLVIPGAEPGEFRIKIVCSV